MTKYNKSNIMRNAWALRKSVNVSMSIALKSAWALEKAMMQAEKEAAAIDWNTKVAVNDWVKYGKNRTYVEIREYTNAWNCKRTYKLGYVDNLAGVFVAA